MRHNADIVTEARNLRAEIRSELLMLSAVPRAFRHPIRWSLKRTLAVLEWVEREARKLPR